MPGNLKASTFWSPQGLSRSLEGNDLYSFTFLTKFLFAYNKQRSYGNEICAFLGYYAVYDNFIPTFRDRQFVCTETSVENCRSTLHKISKERRSHFHGAGNPKYSQDMVRFVLSCVLQLIISQCRCHACRYLSRPSFCSEKFCSRYPADPPFFHSQTEIKFRLNINKTKTGPGTRSECSRRNFCFVLLLFRYETPRNET